MKICIVGAGYVGLVAAAGFADKGHQVSCCDLDPDRIDGLKRGQIPIHEPGLLEMIKRNSIKFTTELTVAVAGSQVIFLTVGTPPREDGSANLDFIFRAANTVSASLATSKWVVIVIKSTVPVGTGDKVEEIVGRNLDRECFAVVSNPEFLKEGDAVNDFMSPERVVIGSSNARGISTMWELYEPFVKSRQCILFMDRRSAELTKYAANSMLAARISFMNELSGLCERVGADIEEVRKGMGSDSRIGSEFLRAGAGFGGSCFPKDLRAVINTAREAGTPLKILEAVSEVNESQKHRLSQIVLSHFDNNVRGKTVAVWGLAFKPETDDVREAPALTLIKDMLSSGANVVVTDPIANTNAYYQLGERVTYRASKYDCAKDADILALVTEWDEYRCPDLKLLGMVMKGLVVVDGRNVLDRKSWELSGFVYYGVGRKS